MKSLDKHELFGLGTKQGVIDGIPVYCSDNLETIDFTFDIVIICHAAVASGTTILSNNLLYNINVSLTERIVNKFKESFVIYTSTASVYDKDLNLIIESSCLNPQSNYALSKLWGEKVVSFHEKHSILRISSMFGIGMKENTLIPNYVNQALKKGIIEIWGTGERLQNYIHVEDVVKYINLIISDQVNLYGQLILAVDKNQFSNLDIAKMISNITNAEIKFINEDNSSSFCYNNKYSATLLRWTPEEDIKKRLQSYIEWKQKKY
jgi:UDP-glucose 4-epimerase